MKPFGAATVLLCILAVCGALAGCDGAPADAGFAVARYANETYGFSIQYPAGFAKLEVPSDAGDPEAPLLDVFFADPAGTRIAGRSVDTLETAVYRMNAAPVAADFTRHKRDFERMLLVLIGDLPGLKVAEPLAWTTVEGRPAVTETYTCKISGQDVAACAKLIFRDATAYLVRMQAGRATWATTGRELAASMATFAFL